MTGSSRAGGSVAAFLESRLIAVSAADGNLSAAAPILSYCSLIDDTIDRRGYGHSLFRVSPSLLKASSADVFKLAAARSGEVRCALHMAVDPDDDFVWINGLAKAEGQPSRVVTELLARAIVVVERMRGADTRFRACYRVFPAGFRDATGTVRGENDASARLFEKFDFTVKGMETVEIKGTDQDRHLYESAEPDGRTFRTKIVESTEYTLETARHLALMLPNGRGGA